MRSGFLNSTSDSPSSGMEKEKGSRNKRKYISDPQQQQQQQSLASTLSNGESSKNGVTLDGNLCNNSKNGVILGGNFCNNSTHTTDPSAFVPDTNGCCTYGHHMMLPNHLSSYKPLENAPTVDCRLQPGVFSPSPQHITHPKHSKEYPELHDDSDWDQFSEAQLEEILISMLDDVYKDAIQRITTSCDYSHDDALNAVLRNGRWNGRDALSSIVESSLAWLQNKEARTTTTGDTSFTNLKQLESYVLAEMICMLRKVRIHMSKGDAMWCLLMCDLNVFLACAMDEDVAPTSSVKDRVVPNAMPSTVSGSDSSSSNVPVSSTVASIPLPERIPQVNAQSFTPFKSSHVDTCSAFSTPRFSSSSIGKVSVASRKGSSKPSLSKSARAPLFNSKNNDSVKSSPGNISKNAAVVNSYQFSSSQVPNLEEHAISPGLYSPESKSKLEYADKMQSWQPDHVVPSVITSDVSPHRVRMAHVSDAHHVPHSLEVDSNSSSPSSFQTTPLQQKSAIFRGNDKVCVNMQLQPVTNYPVQTDLQIGRPSTATLSTFQGSACDSWTTPAASLASTRGELSLTTLPIGNAGKESNGNSHIYDFNKEIPSPPTDHSSSGSGQLLDCVDTNAEERKTVMLWQLVDRVKYLESQHQDWTDWAQQKVMQATRRLTKDSAELKALRQERDEYIRLKKEKQTLEESTMKKLAEMENALRKAVSQVDRANSTAWRLEAENAAVRGEMEAAKLAAVVSVSECQEASKREKKSSKKAQGWEKQKLKLQEDLLDGKRTLSSYLEQLSLGKDRLQQTEARLRQEKLALKEALVRAEVEKKAREQSEQLAKRREETMQKKYEAESQRHRDEVKKLEKEIAKVKLSLGLQPSPLSWENNFGVNSGNVNTCSTQKLKTMHAKLLSEIAELQKSQVDVRRDRECVMCMSEEVSVVFLPCAHQSVCVKCNELHAKAGLGDCPSCRTPIQRRIPVYGVRS